MAIINQRWPRDLTPQSCDFKISRNDLRQESVRTRRASVIRRGRPLWSADCIWTLPNGDRLARLRYWLESLDGFGGSAQIWDFASPYPFGIQLATNELNGANIRTRWTYLTSQYFWTASSLPSHWIYTSNPTLSANVAINATSLPVTGLDPGKIACVQGQYIQVGRRLYLAADTVTVSGGGTATIPLLRGLIAAAASGDSVRFVESACEMQLVKQDWSQQSRAGDGLASVSASFIESVEDVT